MQVNRQPVNKYLIGQVINERVRPAQRLTIRRYVDGLYYCKTSEPYFRNDLVFLEVDIKLDGSYRSNQTQAASNTSE
jgi:hypothetical protein